MHFWYLPEPTFSMWPCAVLLLVFVPISIYHERHWRSTLDEYSRARADAGATDTVWPPADARHVMGVQPWLLFVSAAVLAVATAIGIVVLASWPHRLSFFDEVLNYYDRPYLLGMCAIGVATVVAVVAVALDIGGQPWAPVADKLRRAIYAPADKRAEIFAAALAADPGVPRAADPG